MDNIQSYLSIIDPRLLNHLTGKLEEFVQILQAQKWLSEKAFAYQVCDGNYDQKYYSSLKSRTIKTLQILAMMSPLRGGNEVKKKYEICQKKMLLGQKFLTTSQTKEGVRLIKQAFRLAVDYDFVHLASELSSLLYHHHVYYTKNNGEASFYADQMDKYVEDYFAEKKAERHFFYVISNSDTFKQPELIEDALKQMEEYVGDGIKYKVYVFVLKIHLHFHLTDYEAVIQNCEQVLYFFKDKKGVNVSHYHSFLKNKGIAHMALAQYPQAEASFQKAARYAPAKSYNDYLLRYYQLLNALRAGHYQNAYDLHQQSKRCPYESLRLQFAIIEAYHCFLAQLGYLKIEKKFRLGKYLNETFKAQADKQGDNVNVLIAELLVYLARDRGKFIDRIEAVKHYTYRYLQGDSTRRAKWFIKILCLLPRVDFQVAAWSEEGRQYLDLLEEYPVSLGENFAVEIIPFDVLFNMIIQKLEEKAA